MQSVFRFSMFGNYEKFATNNTEMYLKLINYFGLKGYKPATANELQLLPNGQVKTLIMPTFSGDSGIVIEIMSNRINFQKVVNEKMSLLELSEAFKDEFIDVLTSFWEEVKLTSNRLALNIELVEHIDDSDIPLQSNYFSDVEKNEMSLRNSSRTNIGKEMCNVILERYDDVSNHLMKRVYDINTIGENQIMRFDLNTVKNMLVLFIDTAFDVEKGLK